MSSAAKTSAIITAPSSSTVIVPKEYSEEDKEKIAALREYAETLRLPESDPYYPNERRWLSDPGCAERYMRAAKFRLDDAKKRIAGTLAWRREYKPDLIPPEEVRIESETGKIILNGFDINGRPIITMHPGRENTKMSDRQLRHLVYVLERAVDLMPPGQDSLMIIVDYRSTTLRTSPPISQAVKVLSILQNHYVERLGRAIVMNLPFILSFFYKGISPFLDPVTRDKMRFNPDLKTLVPDDHLDVQFGGVYNYEFEPIAYWNGLISACHIASDGSRTIAIPSSPPSIPPITKDASPSSGTRDSDIEQNVPADHSGSESDGMIDEPRTPANGMRGDSERAIAPESKRSLETAAAANTTVTPGCVVVEAHIV